MANNACLLVFTSNEAAIRARMSELAQLDAKSKLIRMLYEAALPENWESPEIRDPMDYLTAADVDAIYNELESRQRSMPSAVLSDGVALADWTGGLDAPPSIWAWLPALVPYWHVTDRLSRLVERIIETERPSVVALAVDEAETEWAALTVARIIAFRWPDIRLIGAPEKQIEPTARQRATEPPRLADLRASRNALRARTQLAAACGSNAAALAGEPRPHIVLLTRGARGAIWMQSRATGQSHLLDEYSERMPDALAELCRQSGARLTIVYEGPEPESTTSTPLYSSREPCTVGEISSQTVARISSSIRVAVQAFFSSAIIGVCNDPAFQAYFTFGGVNLFEQFRSYLSRSIANLATLHVTQYEAWRVFLEELKPDVIVGGRLESKPWVSYAAHEIGARTVSIKLGIGEEMMPSMIAVGRDGNYAHDAYPDAFLVWGTEQSRYLSERIHEFRGVIAPVGRARSDTFVIEGAWHDKHAARRRMGLPENGQIILFGANYRSRYGKWPEQQWGSVCFSAESYRQCLETLVAAARDIPNGHVLVKPHPADDIQFIVACIEKYGAGRASLVPAGTGMHNVEIIGASDVLVSSVSSMFAEAVLMGKPCVNIWQPDINLLYERGRFEKYSAIAFSAETFVEMRDAVVRFLTDEKAYCSEVKRAFGAVERYFGAADGSNAHRAARAVLDM